MHSVLFTVNGHIEFLKGRVGNLKAVCNLNHISLQEPHTPKWVMAQFTRLDSISCQELNRIPSHVVVEMKRQMLHYKLSVQFDKQNVMSYRSICSIVSSYEFSTHMCLES